MWALNQERWNYITKKEKNDITCWEKKQSMAQQEKKKELKYQFMYEHTPK